MDENHGFSGKVEPPRQGYVCVIIQDNGLGIVLGQNRSQTIFELYKRMHTHTEGKGLGLYLVKEQLESMGGKIAVESQPGQGSQFRVFFKIGSSPLFSDG